MALDYMVAAVGAIAPYDIALGDITADDAGWTELGSVSTSVPNTYVSSGNPHENQTTTVALKAFVRTIPGETVGGPWTFSVTQDAGSVVYNFGGSVNPNGTASLGGVLFRYGGVTGVLGSTSVAATWGDGDPQFSTGPSPGPDVVVPPVGGSDPSLSVLIMNGYSAGSSGPLAPIPDYVDGTALLPAQLLAYDGPQSFTLTGQTPAPIGGGLYDFNWGCAEAIAINLPGPYTVCDSDWDETFADASPTLTVSLTSDSFCAPVVVEALYGWGVLTGGGSGGAW